MKIGFNEGCNRFCENHSVLEDLDLCEKYGFDYIDIQSECLDREIAAGKYTIDDLGAWFADPKHHLKMLSYNALIFFNICLLYTSWRQPLRPLQRTPAST